MRGKQQPVGIRMLDVDPDLSLLGWAGKVGACGRTEISQRHSS